MQTDTHDKTKYDVVIAGASFAGLAVAAQLSGKHVLLMDKKPLGTRQTSACGCPLSTLKALGLENAVLRLHDKLVVHTTHRVFVYPLPEPYCTFDYGELCRLLRAQGDAQLIQLRAHGLNDDGVITSKGTVRTRIVVDASGWRATLGSCLRPGLARRNQVSFGIETTASYDEDGLHFWYDPKRVLPARMGWLFPIEGFSRIGVWSYEAHTNLSEELDRFLGNLGLERTKVHGGYFPSALREPVIDHLFLVGDAAGQCMGLTGEGIRPALFFGTRLGQLLNDVLEGTINLAGAERSYRDLVKAHARGYHQLYLMQKISKYLPVPIIEAMFSHISHPVIRDRMLKRYLSAFSLNTDTTA